MTGAQFYEKLGEASERMKWFIDGNKNIRGKFRYSKKKKEYCPITAVAKLVKNEFYDIGDFEVAADSLKLNNNHANEIADAADGLSYSSAKIRRHLKKVLNLV